MEIKIVIQDDIANTVDAWLKTLNTTVKTPEGLLIVKRFPEGILTWAKEHLAVGLKGAYDQMEGITASPTIENLRQEIRDREKQINDFYNPTVTTTPK